MAEDRETLRTEHLRGAHIFPAEGCPVCLEEKENAEAKDAYYKELSEEGE